MTTPGSPETAPEDGQDGPKEGVASRAPRQRPAGEAGGHSVQDWEQPVQRPGQPARLEAPDARPALGIEDADSPSPPTVPRYLRADGRAGGPQAIRAAPAFDARRQTLTAQSAALVDALTRGLADSLAVSLRPVVASTVDALIPMLLTLGSVPDPAVPAAIPDAVSWADEAVADGEAS